MHLFNSLLLALSSRDIGLTKIAKESFLDTVDIYIFLIVFFGFTFVLSFFLFWKNDKDRVAKLFDKIIKRDKLKGSNPGGTKETRRQTQKMFGKW